MSYQHEKLDYVEFPASDLAATKAFFTSVFGWQFTDFGEGYTAFDRQGIEGGFYLSDKTSNADSGSALLIFYSSDITATKDKIITNGGKIKTDIFSFPGGRRFHFTCPSGNEFAVWTDIMS